MNRAELELCRWHAVSDERALQQAAIETIFASAAQAIHEHGHTFSVQGIIYTVIVFASGALTASHDPLKFSPRRKIGVPTPVISAALFERFASRGDADYANRLLSALRKQFGGHDEKKEGR
jgi:hypothetical protein